MNFSELLTNPSMLHAAVVHMPIAAAVFGLIMIALSAIFHRNNTLRLVTLLLFAIMATSAWVGIETGENARDLVPNTLPTAVWDQLTDHAAAAQRVLYAALVVLVFLVISLIRVDFLRVGGLLCAAIAAIVANVFVAQTGHMGGALVYNEGVGTPHVHKPTVPVETAPVETAPVDMPTEDGVAMVEEVPEPAEVPEAPEESEDWLPIKDFTMEEARQVSYTRDVWPLIDDQCVVCHESPDPDGDYDITTVANMMKAGKKGGPGVVPGKPDESSIITYIRGIANPRMPEDEPPLSDESLHMLRMWIAAGAIDDSPAAEEMVEETPAVVPAPAEEKMTEEAPAADTPAETPAPEATPAPAEEKMKDEAPAADAPEAAPAPDATPTPEPAPAPETTSEPAPAEEKMKEEAPATDAVPVPEEAPVPEATPAPAEEKMKEEAPAPEAPAVPPVSEAPSVPAEPDAVEAAPPVDTPADAPAPEATTPAPAEPEPAGANQA